MDSADYLMAFRSDEAIFLSLVNGHIVNLSSISSHFGVTRSHAPLKERVYSALNRSRMQYIALTGAGQLFLIFTEKGGPWKDLRLSKLTEMLEL